MGPFWIWGNTAATKWKWGSREGNNTHVPTLHPVLHDMFMCVPVEGCLPTVCMTVYLYVCAVVCKRVSVFVCGYADRVLEDRLLPCCSPLRLWLASLSRTETSASICVAAPRPYWWAATSCDKSASCHCTPPIGESWTRQEACKEDQSMKQISLSPRYHDRWI